MEINLQGARQLDPQPEMHNLSRIGYDDGAPAKHASRKPRTCPEVWTN
jgi:hypothetical protein